MTQPQGFVHLVLQNHVCHLRKTLYGLKEAPWVWFSWLNIKLVWLGFVGSEVDPSLFISQNQFDPLMVLVYVDDILVTGPNS